MKQLISLLLFSLVSITVSAQSAQQLDSLYLRDGSVAVVSVTKITADAIEFMYPGETAINILGTGDVARIRMGSGRVITYPDQSILTEMVHEQTAVDYPEYFDLELGHCTMRFVLIKGGTFNMGYDGRHSRRYGSEPVHRVSVSSFYISEDFVKRDIFNLVNKSDSENRSSRRVSTNWKGANSFAEKLAAKTGLPYRLVSEAEWEAAAISENSNLVFDSIGFRELCYDIFAEYIGNLSTVSVEPVGPTVGKWHVVRCYVNGPQLYSRERETGENLCFRLAIKAKDLFPKK